MTSYSRFVATSAIILLALQSSFLLTSAKTAIGNGTSSTWDALVKVLKEFLSVYSCSNHSKDILDRVMFCWDALDQDKTMYDEVDLTNGVGCCILSKFDYCLRTKVTQLCSSAAANITMTCVEMLGLYTSTDCKITSGQSLPKYPSGECDNIMLPGSRFEGLLGLVISVSLFSLVVGLFAWIILCLARRSMSDRSNSYQAL
jgi:hypothetical protein